MPEIHESHPITDTGRMKYCRVCGACTCHGPTELRAVCKEEDFDA